MTTTKAIAKQTQSRSRNTAYNLAVNAVAACVRSHVDLAAAWNIINRDEQMDLNTKIHGVELAISKGWATQAEWNLIP